MFKRMILFMLLCVFCLTAVSCGETQQEPSVTGSSETASVPSQTENTVSEESVASEESIAPKDAIPPAFVGATDGKLDPVTVDCGEIALEELLELVEIKVADNVTAEADIVLAIADAGGCDLAVAGVYTVTISATDEASNSATATVEVTVRAAISASTIVLGDEISYVEGRADALSYTSSGTAFRTSDTVCVLGKDDFVSQYNQYAADHTNNGGVPFFPNGVIVILDQNDVIVQVRIAAGETIQIDADGTKNSGFAWSNSLDEANGGGMFKGILSDLGTLIPDGGKILFVGNPGDQKCRLALIRALFLSSYESGAIAAEQQDVYPIGAVVEFS